MRKPGYLILLLSVFAITEAFGQPLNASLSGKVVIDQDSTFFSENPADISINDFRYIPSDDQNIFTTASKKPGISLLASAVIPGSGQAINGNWGRAAAYFLIDVVSVAYYIDRNNTAKRNERAYENYADQNWSPLAYAQWLVAYSEANGINNGWEQLEPQLASLSPDFTNTTNDWDKINGSMLNLIRTIEQDTPYFYPDSFTSVAVCTSNNRCRGAFSHVLQDLGSQQYYELMSKYYQFQPGWQDFYSIWNPDPNSHNFQYSWDRNMLTQNFIKGRDDAEEFNNNYRQAGNILKLIMVNHIVSAFDAYFTVKLKNSRIDTQANLLRPDAFSVIWHF